MKLGFLLTLLLGGGASGRVWAQAPTPTVLWPGEVVWTGYTTTGGDADWGFIPLVDLAAGTQLRLTTNGWQAAGGFRPGETTSTYTTPAGGVSKGQVISYSTSQAAFSGPLPLATAGDQLLLYQGTDLAPTFVAGLTYGPTGWTDATSAATSALPPGLTAGTTALALPDGPTASYSAATRAGLPADLRGAFNTPANWTTSPTRGTWTTTALLVSEGLVPDALELAALQDLYTSTQGTGWVPPGYWPGRTLWQLQDTPNAEHWATWFGLGTAGGDITSLDLNAANLQGSLPASLGNLTQLTYLNLPNCAGLTGPLPASIGQLANLTYLRTTRSPFTGPLPPELGQLTKLQYLYLNDSRFSGSIPASLGQLTNLLLLSLDNNRLSGPIPPELGQLANLTLLDLGNLYKMQPGQGNQLSGGIPPELGQLAHLTHLDLCMSPLGGSIPPELGQLRQLTYLALDDCHLSGAVPAEVLALPQLSFLDFGMQNAYYHDYNRLSGLPPASWLANPAGLDLLLGYNQFEFGVLESYFVAPGQLLSSANSTYAPQTLPQDEQTVVVTARQPLSIPSAIGGTHTQYQWQRELGGSWQALPAATAATYQVASATAADAGRYRCQATNTVVTGLTLYSAPFRVQVTSAALPPNDPSADLDRNWSFSRTYDLAGTVTSESKQFADALGRPTQSQSKNLAEHHVFASQRLNNTGGVAVLTTLSAPINNQEFKYKVGFVTATTPPAGGGTPTSRDYDFTNFERPTNGSSPDPLDETTPGTLGYYYSQNNAWEPATAATHNPYSLSEPTPGPLGGVRRAAGPGDELRLGAGREGRGRDFPLLNELDHYARMRALFVPGSPTPSRRAQGVKVVSISPNGTEVLAFSTREGQAVASCLSGDQYPASTLTGRLDADPANAAGSPRYQDLHVAASAAATPVTITDGSAGSPSSFVLIDLQQNPLVETAYTGSQALSLAPGFYRLLVSSGTVSFSYPVHYGNFSYVFYDDAGRPVASIAPQGLAELLPTGLDNAVVAVPHFVTTKAFDTSGRVLSATSPDEGTTRYVYARDGRIRFSQSAGQAQPSDGSAPRFSYSNYDRAGRVIESGEYTTTATINNNTYSTVCGLGTEYQTFVLTAPAGQKFVGIQAATYGSGTGPTCDAFVFANGCSADVTAQVRMALASQLSSGATTLSFPISNATLGSDPCLGFVKTLRVLARTADVLATPGQGLVFEDMRTASPAANSVLQPALLEERVSASQPAGSLDVARCTQRSQAWYDLPQADAALGSRQQEFVLGAVAKTSKGPTTTWYSYNDLGQLTWLVQQAPVVGIKTVDYTYDAAGNVTRVAYQAGQADAFYHDYTYDANQRLTQVATSPDGSTQTVQARYFYYLHGPLKRVETAGNLQGTDYTYTVQGWLKSINGANRHLDGDSPKTNGIAKDLFGLTLDYFSGDYRSAQPGLATPTIANAPATRYDGLVRSAAWFTAASDATRQQVFTYDAKGQLQQADFGLLRPGATPLAAGTFAPALAHAYEEGNLAYDFNGNLQTLRRRDGTGVATDDFTYRYAPGTNQLAAVNNPAGGAVLDYDYDATGQLTRQRDEKGQRYLTYDVTGKVTGVYRDAAHSQPLVVFTYDERGFRASKASYDPATYQLKKTTYSVRDAAGNELSIYVQDAATPGSGLQRSEVPLYGASRLGALTRLDDGSLDYRYELNDQLGNARVIFHKPTTTSYTATMEATVASQEEHDFTNVASTRFAAPGHNGSAQVALLGLTSGQQVGPGKTLTVQKGDTITFTAYAWLTAAVAQPGGPHKTQALQVVPLVGAAALGTDAAPTSPGLSTPEPTPPARPSSVLTRLSAGLGLTLAAKQRPDAPATTQAITGSSGSAYLHFIIRDEQGTVVRDDYQEVNGSAPTSWQQLQVGLRLAQAGTVELRVETDGALGPDVYFDDVRVDYTTSTIVQEQHTYAYGAPMQGLNYVIGPTRYRHGFQGQFAEIDPETGTEDFELRLYDSRIGRWTAPDPAGQYASPYVGMGNNPVSSVDPDGGFDIGTIWGSIKAAAGFGRMVGSSVAGNLRYVAEAGATQIGSVSLQVGLGAASAAVRAARGPMQSATNSNLFTNETEAYKHMLTLQRSEGKEMSAALVIGPNGRRGVFVFAYGDNEPDLAYFTPSQSEQVHDAYRRPGAKLIINQIQYKIVGLVHTHPTSGWDGYEGPSGNTLGTVNSARGANQGDDKAYVANERIPFFVIGPNQVSKLNPSKPYFNDYGKNPHQIMTTSELKNGMSLFNYIK